MIRSILLLSLLSLLSTVGYTAEISIYQKDVTGNIPIEEYREDHSVNPGNLVRLFTLYTLLKSIDDDILSEYFRIPASECHQKILPLLSPKTLSELLNSVGMNQEFFLDKMKTENDLLGLTNTYLVSPFESKGNLSSAKDISILLSSLINQYPTITKNSYPFFKDSDTNTINSQVLSSINHVIDFSFGGVFSDQWNAVFLTTNKYETLSKRRIMSVILNSDSSENIAIVANQTIQKGYSDFVDIPLFSAGDTVGKISILNGEISSLPVKVTEPIFITVPKNDPGDSFQRDFVVSIKHNNLLSAPIYKGDRVGTLTIFFKNSEIFASDVYATQSIPSGGFFNRLLDNIKVALTLNTYESTNK